MMQQQQQQQQVMDIRMMASTVPEITATVFPTWVAVTS